MGAPKI
jgi:hypothetical protein